MMKQLINECGLKNRDVAERLGLAIGTVYDWTTERRAAAPYVEKAIRAIAADLTPAPEDITQRLWKALGVTRQHPHNWRKAGKTPLAARYAAAWILTHGAQA